DEQLDQELHTLRALVRQTINTSQLENHIEHLEQAVLKSETQAQQRQETLQMTLAYLVQQLLQLQLPKALQKTLKAFAKDLSKQLAQQHGIHKVLGQFKELQEQALIAAQPKQQQVHTTSTPGLFARLFKSSDSQAAPQPAATDTTTEAEPTENTQSKTAQAHATEPEPSLTAAQTRLEHSYMDDAQPLSDISYSSVAQHIHTTLMTLLDDLPISSEHEQQAQALRQRLTDGLNWYELVPLLDELSVIIIATAQGASGRELTDYLLELNQRLTSFYNSLESTSSGYLASVQDAKTLDNDLRLHVTGLQDDVQTSNDLASLKKLVDARLDSVVSTLQVYQEKRTNSEAQIIERLQALSEHSRQMEQEAQQLSVKLEEQRQQALIDPLTGLANRAAWNERSALEHANLQAHSSLLLSIIDIDHFKRINDNYGHLAGDKVLKIIASELQKRLRETDFIARFGGEEYAVLMPDTPLEEGCELINTLRLAIAACPFNFKGEPVSVTLSAGVGKIAADESLDQAFDRVDQALYAAKKAGRNRIQSA
ncbi:MAG TPA: GGDEF domain-containing protein, partial [Thiopseudomonas sp.]|nr:GGDEF domain-containing protein [Thiopseudomonas sp.]